MNKDELKEYQIRFLLQLLQMHLVKKIRGYSFKIGNDKNKTKAFIDKLKLHDLRY